MAPPSSYIGAGAGASAIRAPNHSFSNGSGYNAHGNASFYEPTIRISQHEFNNLMLIARQYANLRRNLIQGGVDEATLNTLSEDDEPSNDAGPLQPQLVNTDYSERPNNGPAYKTGYSSTHESQASDFTSSAGSDHGFKYNNGHGYRSQSHTPAPPNAVGDILGDDGLEEGEVPQGVGFDAGHRQHQSTRHDDRQGDDAFDQESTSHHGPGDALGPQPVHDRKCLRTLQLVSLPESATLADVAAVVRGGLLLELFIRAHDRSAFVSFAREPDAKAYFEHVKKHDLYIKGKRVDIRWSERQHTLLAYIGNRINTGATRNLVVRQCHPRVTEASVREDLDHIFNLVIVSVKFGEGNCYISTNSVHNALFARSCMMSRMAYRTSRIEWMPDECAQPLERIAPVVRPRKPKPAPKPKTGFGVKSRFQLLNLDDSDSNASTDNDSDEDSDDDNNDDTSDRVHGGGGVRTRVRK